VFSLPERSEEEESTLHDYPIYEICAIAESLGYNIEEKHLAGEHGPDIIIRNRQTSIGVIIESEVGHNITDSAYWKFEREAREYLTAKNIKAIIVITETPRRVWRKSMKGVEPRRNFFVVAGSVFKDVMPALLVKLLG